MTNTTNAGTRATNARGVVTLVAVSAATAPCGGGSGSTEPSATQRSVTKPAATLVATTEPSESPAEPLVADVDFGAEAAAPTTWPRSATPQVERSAPCSV